MFQDYITTLLALEDVDRANRDRQYHKSNRIHLGIIAPTINTFVHQICASHNENELYSIADLLWHSDIFDAKIAAAKIVSHKKITPSPLLWNVIERFLIDIDGWALEDTLAHAAWKCVLQSPTYLDVMEDWLHSSSMWIRRATLVYTLCYTKQEGKSPQRILSWASYLSTDTEWFIQKAIGWWLRELSKRSPATVLSFVEEHKKSLKPFARKEALRKIPIGKGI